MTKEIVVKNDLVYAQDGRPLLWDVYSPALPAGDRPVILLLHGGGWRTGNRSFMAEAATLLAERGFVAVCPEYRLIDELAWPGPLNDVRTAVRAVRAHATSLAVNSDHLFVMGFSAGAHLALLAAGAPSTLFAATSRPYGELSEQIAGVAAFFPIAQLNPMFAQQLGIGADQVEEVSPVSYASTLPPTVIFCGDADPITPAAQSIGLHEAINRAGGVADLRLFSGLVHEFVSLPGMKETTIQDAVAFFDRTVIGKAAFEQELKKLKAWWTELLNRPR